MKIKSSIKRYVAGGEKPPPGKKLVVNQFVPLAGTAEVLADQSVVLGGSELFASPLVKASEFPLKFGLPLPIKESSPAPPAAAQPPPAEPPPAAAQPLQSDSSPKAPYSLIGAFIKDRGVPIVTGTTVATGSLKVFEATSALTKSQMINNLSAAGVPGYVAEQHVDKVLSFVQQNQHAVHSVFIGVGAGGAIVGILGAVDPKMDVNLRYAIGATVGVVAASLFFWLGSERNPFAGTWSSKGLRQKAVRVPNHTTTPMGGVSLFL